MCGISGYLGRFDVAVLQNMAEMMTHRGPDNMGVYCPKEGSIGLAHNRLSIIDLSSSAHQPMLTADSSVAITFNGEIYNFKQLRAKLVELGHNFKSESDTEVVLQAYMEYGSDMLAKLDGIFAFAIWDSRIGELFVARDRFGVKPFYYSQLAEGFVFASELKSILSNPSVPRDIDLTSAFNHVSFLYSPGESTMLKSVKKLEPGFAMIISSGKIKQKWRYFDSSPFVAKHSFQNEKQAIEGVREGLRSSVASQLVSDVPVGAFLSGGLDSSAIVALIKKDNPDFDLQCFTMRLNGAETRNEGFVDDLPYALAVAKHCNVPLNIVDVDASEILKLPRMIFHLDEPQADPAPLNVLAISQLASAHGIKVLLSGAGGDDLFTGYRRHRAIELESYLKILPKAIRRSVKTASGGLSSGKSSFARRLKKFLEYADWEGDQRIASYFSWLNPSMGEALFSQESLKSMQGYNPILELSRALSELAEDSSSLQKLLYLETKGFLPDHNLNYTDKMGMATGVEIRVPFLGADVANVASRVPDHYKQRGRIGKWVLKKSMESLLPRNVIYRPKTGFGAPLRYWMSNQLKPLVDELLSESSIRSRGVFDPAAVRNMIKDDREGKQDYSYVIFSIFCLEIWFRTFTDVSLPEIITF